MLLPEKDTGDDVLTEDGEKIGDAVVSSSVVVIVSSAPISVGHGV
jgi:hypothetical protein